MKKNIFLLFLAFLISSCTNRYEEQNKISHHQEIKYIKKHIIKKHHKKKIRKHKKRIKHKRERHIKYKITKKLLLIDYLKYSNLENNFFNNKLMLKLILNKKKHNKKVYIVRKNIKKIKHKKISKIKNIKKEPLNSNKKRKLCLTATAYTSHKSQTDSTPFLAAWNNKIRPGMKVVAVSHDLIKKHGLKNGVKVKIKGLKGHYVVKDKMNKRFKKRIDIYMGLNKKRALRWGKRKVVLYY